MDYSFTDKVMIKELKSVIKMMEKSPNKKETPGEVAMDISSFYRVLEYYLCYQDYNAFIEKRMAKRNKKGSRTARENIEDLCDKDTFVEFGSMIVAAQRGRKSEKELIEQTPADGLITGIASVNGKWFDKENR